MTNQIIDLATIGGITLAILLVVAAIAIDGNIAVFWDSPSAMIVVGGTLAITTACFSLADIKLAQRALFRTVFYRAEKPTETARRALQVAEMARSGGLLNLERRSGPFKHNPIFFEGMSMLIDGFSPDDAEKALSQEIAAMSERHYRSALVFRKAGEIAPALGLIGTLIGLVQMLGGLNNPASIGPAMALALLTTFYGAILSYVICFPLATKLERNSRQEILTAQLYAKAVGSIGRKENPRQLEMILNGMLPASKRVKYFD